MPMLLSLDCLTRQTLAKLPRMTRMPLSCNPSIWIQSKLSDCCLTLNQDTPVRASNLRFPLELITARFIGVWISTENFDLGLNFEECPDSCVHSGIFQRPGYLRLSSLRYPGYPNCSGILIDICKHVSQYQVLKYLEISFSSKSLGIKQTNLGSFWWKYIENTAGRPFRGGGGGKRYLRLQKYKKKSEKQRNMRTIFAIRIRFETDSDFSVSLVCHPPAIGVMHLVR